jgi:hypothetical protein
VDLGADLEGVALAGSDEGDDLAAPAVLRRDCQRGTCVGRRGEGTHADDGPVGYGGVLGLGGLDDVGNLLDGLGRRVLLEEAAQVLLLLFVGGRVPLDGARLALEEVGDEDAMLIGGEDIGALEGLGEVAEDVVDDEDSLLRVRGPGGVCARESVSARIDGQKEGEGEGSNRSSGRKSPRSRPCCRSPWR